MYFILTPFTVMGNGIGHVRAQTSRGKCTVGLCDYIQIGMPNVNKILCVVLIRIGSTLSAEVELLSAWSGEGETFDAHMTLCLPHGNKRLITSHPGNPVTAQISIMYWTASCNQHDDYTITKGFFVPNNNTKWPGLKEFIKSAIS